MDFRVCVSDLDVIRAFKEIAACKHIAVDTESTGLHLLRDRIIMIPVSTPHAHYVFPINLLTRHNADAALVRAFLAPILANPAIRKSFWNYKYDRHMFANFGIGAINNYVDWMIAAWLLDENRSKGLKERCKDVGLDLQKFPFKQYFTLRRKWEVAHQKNAPTDPGKKPLKRDYKDDLVMWEIVITKWQRQKLIYSEWKKENKPITPSQEAKLRGLEEHMLGYAYEDTLATFALADHCDEQLRAEPKIRKVFFKVWNPYADVLFKMERRGMTVNMPYIRKTQKLCEKKLAVCTANVYKIVGKHFDIDSNKQLAHILFDLMQVPVMRVSKKTGAPSADHDSLELLSRVPLDRKKPYGTSEFKPKYEVAKAILEYRKYSKLYGTYLSPDSGMMKSVYKGRIHTSYNPCGTDTGRLSSSGPNLQNLPRSAPDNFYIRKAFIAPRGYRYIIGDESQFEIRLIADKTGDKELVKAYNNDEDLHQKTQDGCGVPDRTIAKNLNFGAFYGIGDEKFSHMLTIKTGKYVAPEQAEEWKGAFFKLYSGVEPYKMKLCNWARRNGCFVLTYLGRKRRLPDLEANDHYLSSRAERQAFNAIIQGGVADCMTLCMIRADRDPWLRERGIVMVVQVHDEVHFIVPNGAATYDEVMTRLKAIFEHPFKRALKVPLKFSSNGKYALTWHDGK